MKNGNSFITVQYDAGGSYNPSLGDEGYRAYVFDTDKGTWKFQLLKVLQMNSFFNRSNLGQGNKIK